MFHAVPYCSILLETWHQRLIFCSSLIRAVCSTWASSAELYPVSGKVQLSYRSNATLYAYTHPMLVKKVFSLVSVTLVGQATHKEALLQTDGSFNLYVRCRIVSQVEGVFLPLQTLTCPSESPPQFRRPRRPLPTRSVLSRVPFHSCTFKLSTLAI